MRPQIRRLPLSFLVLASFMLLVPGLARAQHGDQVTGFIERTAELIEWAADQVQESESQQARRILEDAKRLHEKSLGQSDQGRPVAALASSRRARELANHAVRLARESRSQGNRVQQRLERLHETRDQIHERAREAGNERALRFVEEADSHLRRAREHYQQGNVDLALHLVESAEDLLSRAARLVTESAGPERLTREIEQVRQVIERIAERAGDDPDEASTGLLKQAREALARAESQAEADRPAVALQQLRLARELASQAASSLDDGPSATSVAAQIERWDERHDRVAERVADRGDQQARRALRQALEHRERAGQALDEGSLELALRQIKAAFDRLNEARDRTR